MRGHRRRDELLHNEFVILALADELFLAAMQEPHHRAPYAVVIDEGQDVLQVLAMVQIEEFGGTRGVVPRQRVGCNIVDLLVADPDDAAVVERLPDIACRFAACAASSLRSLLVHRGACRHECCASLRLAARLTL